MRLEEIIILIFEENYYGNLKRIIMETWRDQNYETWRDNNSNIWRELLWKLEENYYGNL